MYTFILRQLASEGIGIVTAIFPSMLLLAMSLSSRVLCPLLIVTVTLALEPREGEPSALVITACACVCVCGCMCVCTYYHIIFHCAK